MIFCFILINNYSHFINNRIIKFELLFRLICFRKWNKNCSNFLFFIMCWKACLCFDYFYLLKHSNYTLAFIDWIEVLYVNWVALVFDEKNFVDDESLEQDEFRVVELYFANIRWLWSKLPRGDTESFNGVLKLVLEFR